MGFLAVVQELIRVADESPQVARTLPDLLETGTYDADLLAANDIEDPTFVACHFFRAAELRELLSGAGLDVRAVVGLEGPASNFEETVEDADEETFEAMRAVVTDPEFREDPAVADLSNHILAVARAP